MWIHAIVIVILIIAVYTFYHSQYNTRAVQRCNSSGSCQTFQVHRAFADADQSATMLEKMDSKAKKLMTHLRERYVPGAADDNDRRDVPDTEFQETMTQPIISGGDDYVADRVRQLLQNYDSNRVYEISPLNPQGHTSYADNNRTMIVCLRSRDSSTAIHDENLITFVYLHELTHMMNDGWGHERDFWQLFKFILRHAVEIGIYHPVNYAKNPTNYCGLHVDYNPLFDSRI